MSTTTEEDGVVSGGNGSGIGIGIGIGSSTGVAGGLVATPVVNPGCGSGVVKLESMEGIVKSGNLKKLGKKVENWKTRYFVLNNTGVLSYYQGERTALKGKGKISDIVLKDATAIGPKFFKQGLKSPTPYLFYITYPPHRRTYHVCTQSSEELNAWLSVLQPFLTRSAKQEETKGFLWKMGKLNPSWKKRFFVLSNGELAYYNNIGDEFSKKPKGKLVLSSSSAGFYSCPGLDAPTPHTFSLWHHPHSRTYYFCASNPEEMDKWVQSIGYYVMPS